MKVTDLMVGDWVICNHYQDKPFAKQFGVADFAKGEYVFCEPIPLTEDILVKNGFASSEGYAYLHLDENNFLEFCYYNHRLSKIYMGIEIDDWNKRVTVRDVVFVSNCNYVHEFQHDLKRCGIEKEVQL